MAIMGADSNTMEALCEITLIIYIINNPFFTFSTRYPMLWSVHTDVVDTHHIT